ncbi:MAG: hypothetical protein M3Z24_06255 [Chloroflexota bacterium]|nr:hypothetical protein [Chloroflexota bacterium]
MKRNPFQRMRETTPSQERVEKKPRLRPYHVYALLRPGRETIFYVGLTNEMGRRYQEHLAGDDNVRKSTYIRLRLEDGEQIPVKILETTLYNASQRGSHKRAYVPNVKIFLLNPLEEPIE